MEAFAIFETAHWLVTHRRDSRYPGYLMVSSRTPKADLYELPAEALQELGLVLRQTEILLRTVYAPFKVIFSKLGFISGFACHFHAAAITQALLSEIAAHHHYADEPDGNDAMLFLSRVYCERELSVQESIDMNQTISLLRQTVQSSAYFSSPPKLPSYIIY